jgi:hypothetical protein
MTPEKIRETISNARHKMPNETRAVIREFYSGKELLNMAFETFFRGTPADKWNEDETALVRLTNEERVQKAAVALIEKLVNEITIPAGEIAKALDADKDPGDDFEPWNRYKYGV